MKVTIRSDSRYMGKETKSEESFGLNVEGETMDSPDELARAYLDLRKKLREGIGKEDK